MRIIHDTTEEEVLDDWALCEKRRIVEWGPHWSQDFDSDKSTRIAAITIYRSQLLDAFDGCAWYDAQVEVHDLTSLYLLSYGGFRKITNNSLRILDAVNNELRFHSFAAEGVKRGYAGTPEDYYERMAKSSHKCIIVGPLEGNWTLIDGSHRLISSLVYRRMKGVRGHFVGEVFLGVARKRYTKCFN